MFDATARQLAKKRTFQERLNTASRERAFERLFNDPSSKVLLSSDAINEHSPFFQMSIYLPYSEIKKINYRY